MKIYSGNIVNLTELLRKLQKNS